MSWWHLLVAVALLVANAFFVWAEFALIAVRRTRIEQLAGEGNTRARVALRSIREVSLVLAGAQLGITMASVGLGFVAEPALAHAIEAAIEPWAELPPAVLHAVSFVVALNVVVFFHMVLGEMVPKNVAISEPERSALLVAVPMRAYVAVFRPVIRGLNAIANAGLRLLRIEPRDEVVVSAGADEISAMLEASREEGVIPEFEHRLLSGALGFGQLDAGAVMVPRPDVVALPCTATAEEVERVVVETGLSRIPVYEGDLDHVIGFVHVKDLHQVPPDRRRDPLPPDLLREMLVAPETLSLFDLLSEMRRSRRHFALVIDEYGGTAGIATLEDVLEELVGDIRDEYDPRQRGVRRVGPCVFLARGSLRLDEVRRELPLALPSGEYETLGGFIVDRLGRPPRTGDEVHHDSWLLRVRRVDGLRVHLVELSTPTLEPAQETGGAGGAGRRGRA